MLGRKTLEMTMETHALLGRAHPIPTALTHRVNRLAAQGL